MTWQDNFQYCILHAMRTSRWWVDSDIDDMQIRLVNDGRGQCDWVNNAIGHAVSMALEEDLGWWVKIQGIVTIREIDTKSIASTNLVWSIKSDSIASVV